MASKQEKILITGGAGFIGSNIARELVKRKYYVKIIDNLSTGKISNLSNIIKNINFVRGDIKNLKFLQKELKGADYVLHHAALPSVPRSIADPVASIKNNINGTLNILLASRDNKVKRVVFASSSSVYGDIQAEYKDEQMPINPLSPYALTKSAGEILCRQFYELYGLETVSLRYFNVFGPYQNPQSQYSAVIPKFIQAMLEGERPIIFGDGDQSRDFTFVENNIEANILAMKAKDVAGKVFNIATGQATTLNELVAFINQILKINIKPIYQPARQGDIKYSKARIIRAKNILGYRVKKNFFQGLAETVDWYKNSLAK